MLERFGLLSLALYLTLVLISVLARASDKEEEHQYGCVWGDCENGVGWDKSKPLAGYRYEVIGQFKDGKPSGYHFTIFQSPNSQSALICERVLSDGTNELDLEVCTNRVGWWFQREVVPETFWARADQTSEFYLRLKPRGKEVLAALPPVNWLKAAQRDWESLKAMAPAQLREQFLPDELLDFSLASWVRASEESYATDESVMSEGLHQLFDSTDMSLCRGIEVYEAPGAPVENYTFKNDVGFPLLIVFWGNGQWMELTADAGEGFTVGLSSGAILAAIDPAIEMCIGGYIAVPNMTSRPISLAKHLKDIVD